MQSPSRMYFYCLGKTCMDWTGKISLKKYGTSRGLLDHLFLRHNNALYDCPVCPTFWRDTEEFRNHYAKDHADYVIPNYSSYFPKLPLEKWEDFKIFVQTKTGYTSQDWDTHVVTLPTGIERRAVLLKPLSTYPDPEQGIEKVEVPQPGIADGGLFQDCVHCGSQVEKGNRYVMPMVKLLPGPGGHLEVFGELIEEWELVNVQNGAEIGTQTED